jgi:hypothetical protein
MVLILSGHDDPHVAYVLPKLRAQGADVLWFDPRQFPGRSQIVLELEMAAGFRQKRLRVDGSTVDLDAITAAWLRRPNPVEPAEEVRDPGIREWVREMASDTLTGAFELLRCTWLPAKPRVSRAAHNKPWQLAVAADVGFRLPRTCITNDPEALLDFYASRTDRIIAKPAGNEMPFRDGDPVPVYTQIVERRHAHAAETVRYAPVILQDYVPKQCELRVTVVGDRIFPAAIDSQASRSTQHDWRHYDDDRTAYTPHELPADVAEKCFAIVRAFDLTYGAIDLVLTPEGEYVFLEINPNGQWGFIQDATGMPIADAVADLLLAKEPA